MIEGIDRTVALIGVKSSGLTGGTEQEVVTAVRRCDTSALAETDGHFAAIARDGRTVRLARTIGIPHKRRAAAGPLAGTIQPEGALS